MESCDRGKETSFKCSLQLDAGPHGAAGREKDLQRSGCIPAETRVGPCVEGQGILFFFFSVTTVLYCVQPNHHVTKIASCHSKK